MAPHGDGNLVATIAVMISWFGLGSVMVLSRRRAGEGSAGARRDTTSAFGILVQSLGIGAVWFAPINLPSEVTMQTWMSGAPAGALALLGLALFVWAAGTMGANWSLVARTRADHELVQGGPFALMRHPIYVALFLMMIATAIAVGHAWNLIVAIPLFILGTLSRVGVEERLLRERFGQSYEAYAMRVKRFVPGLV